VRREESFVVSPDLIAVVAGIGDEHLVGAVVSDFLGVKIRRRIQGAADPRGRLLLSTAARTDVRPGDLGDAGRSSPRTNASSRAARVALDPAGGIFQFFVVDREDGAKSLKHATPSRCC
jgi:hypothetical protein